MMTFDPFPRPAPDLHTHGVRPGTDNVRLHLIHREHRTTSRAGSGRAPLPA